MEGLIFLVVLGLAVLLILPVIVSFSTNNRVKDLKNELTLLRKSFDAIYQNINQVSSGFKEEIKSEQPETIADYSPAINDSMPTTTIINEEIPREEISELINEEVFAEPIEETISPINEASKDILPITDRYFLSEPDTTKPKSDIERFIGEKLLSLVGIGVFVLGIFFLVKWAIDQKLITDVGKVSLGLLAGTILIATAHRIRNSVRAFSSILVGGGLAVLYFTVYIAFQDYKLLEQTPAFIIMIVISAFAVLLSIVYDKKELAVIAIIGGFCTPFFVSTGEGNYKVLFSYLLILNIGMFILASFKRWNLVNIISYAFTILIFGGWIIFQFDITKGHHIGGLVIASLFYLIFFGMNLIYNIKNNQKFRPIEISMLLSNTFLYYSAGMYCLSFIQNGEFQGLFTISVAIINFTVTFILYKKENIDNTIVYLLIGLVLTFVSLTGPIQLDGNYITLFWSMEMVLLLWLGQKSGIKLIKETTILLMILTVIGLCKDWVVNYDTNLLLPMLLNKVFITGLVVIASFIIKGALLKKEEIGFWTLPLYPYKRIVQIFTHLLIYLVILLELYFQLDSRFNSSAITANYLIMFNYVFALNGIYFTTIYKKSTSANVFLILACTLISTFFLFNDFGINLRYDYLNNNLGSGIFFSHFLNPAFALVLLFFIGKHIVGRFAIRSEMSKYFAWFATITAVIILSIEIIHIWVIIHFEPGFAISAITDKGIKICLPILWGFTSFALMARGMTRKLKTLRVISLTLFTLTLLKLFIYDIASANQGGKIIAFISLGILLLIVSFMYQKLKGMLIDETPKINEQS